MNEFTYEIGDYTVRVREPTVGEFRNLTRDKPGDAKVDWMPLWDAVFIEPPLDDLPMSVYDQVKVRYITEVLGLGKGGKSSGDGPPKE